MQGIGDRFVFLRDFIYFGKEIIKNFWGITNNVLYYMFVCIILGTTFLFCFTVVKRIRSKQEKQTECTDFALSISGVGFLVIFVILCLVSFATLSIVSANADYKLSAKVAERSHSYYHAQNEINLQLAKLDTFLKETYENSADSDEYFQVAGTTQTYTSNLSDSQTLEVIVDIQYPRLADDHFYEITSWQIISLNQVDYENNMMVIIE